MTHPGVMDNTTEKELLSYSVITLFSLAIVGRRVPFQALSSSLAALREKLREK